MNLRVETRATAWDSLARFSFMGPMIWRGWPAFDILLRLFWSYIAASREHCLPRFA